MRKPFSEKLYSDGGNFYKAQDHSLKMSEFETSALSCPSALCMGTNLSMFDGIFVIFTNEDAIYKNPW